MKWLIVLVVIVAGLSVGFALGYLSTHGNTPAPVFTPSPTPSVNLLPTRTGLPNTSTQYVQRFG